MEIQALPYPLTVCQVPAPGDIDPDAGFWFATRTDQELSLVCVTENTPPGATARSDGWRAFRIGGVLDFSLTGILSRLSTLLAEQHIGIFALSTYNTDYILVKEEDFSRALDTLAAAGYSVARAGDR